MPTDSSSVFACRQFETYVPSVGADRGQFSPRTGASVLAGEGLLKTLIAAGGAFTYSFFLDSAEMAAPGAVMADFQWQQAAGRRLLTPQEQHARQGYFDRRAGLAIARARQSAA